MIEQPVRYEFFDSHLEKVDTTLLKNPMTYDEYSLPFGIEVGRYCEQAAAWDLPNMANMYGCITATAVFVDRLLTGDHCVTTSGLDAVIERPDNEPGSLNSVITWLLNRGHHVTEYQSTFERDVFTPYLRGEMTEEEYRIKDEAMFGITPEEHWQKMVTYHKELLIPEHRSVSLSRAGSMDAGLYEEDKQTPPSKELVCRLLGLGTILILPLEVSASDTHIVATWRPSDRAPAMIFEPGVHYGEDPQSGSYVGPLNDAHLDIVRYEESIFAVS